MKKYIENRILEYIKESDLRVGEDLNEGDVNAILEKVINHVEHEIDKIIDDRINREVNVYQDYYIDDKIKEIKLSLFGKDIKALEIKADVLHYSNTNQYYKFVGVSCDEIGELEYLTALENADTSSF